MEERLLRILHLALKYDATDIHFVSQYNEMTIEMRIDGVMHKIKPKPEDFDLIRYLKYLANLDANIKDLPQTGQFEILVDGKVVTLRFAVIESSGLTSGVLRILSVNMKVIEEKGKELVFLSVAIPILAFANCIIVVAINSY